MRSAVSAIALGVVAGCSVLLIIAIARRETVTPMLDRARIEFVRFDDLAARTRAAIGCELRLDDHSEGTHDIYACETPIDACGCVIAVSALATHAREDRDAAHWLSLTDVTLRDCPSGVGLDAAVRWALPYLPTSRALEFVRFVTTPTHPIAERAHYLQHRDFGTAIVTASLTTPGLTDVLIGLGPVGDPDGEFHSATPMPKSKLVPPCRK